MGGNFLSKLANTAVNDFSTVYKLKANRPERIHMRKEILDKAFEDLFVKNKSKNVTFKNIDNFIKNNLPNIKCTVGDMPANSNSYALATASQNINCRTKNVYINKLSLSFHNNNGLIPKTRENVNAIMHEFSHFLDNTLNIQHRYSKDLMKTNAKGTNFWAKNINEIFEKNVYKKDNGEFNKDNFKKIINLLIKREDLPCDSKVSALKALYKRAKTEKDAYPTGIKYVGKFLNRGKDGTRDFFKIYSQKNYHFPEKAKALKEMVIEEINSQRAIMKRYDK